MRRIDELHFEHSFMVARMLRDHLRREGECMQDGATSAR